MSRTWPSVLAVAALLAALAAAPAARAARHQAVAAPPSDGSGGPTLSVCKALASKLVQPEFKSGFAGYTLFCPTDDAWDEFAAEFGYDVDEPAAALLAKGPAAFPTQLASLMRFHVAKGVLPAAALKDGSTVTTLLPGAAGLKVVREDEGDGEVTVSLAVPRVELALTPVEPDNLDALQDTDLTFEGAYKQGASKYVVHTLDRVLLPQSLLQSLRSARATLVKPPPPTAQKPPATPQKPSPPPSRG